MANIREAIFKAADWIEGNPDLFKFSRYQVPTCDSPGCAIGWIEYFAGTKPRTLICEGQLTEFSGAGWDNKHMTFYNAMNDISGYKWKDSAKDCAESLRLYADKYFPAEPSKELPSGSDICRAIVSKPFRERVEA